MFMTRRIHSTLFLPATQVAVRNYSSQKESKRKQRNYARQQQHNHELKIAKIQAKAASEQAQAVRYAAEMQASAVKEQVQATRDGTKRQTRATWGVGMLVLIGGLGGSALTLYGVLEGLQLKQRLAEREKQEEMAMDQLKKNADTLEKLSTPPIELKGEKEEDNNSAKIRRLFR